MFKVKITQKENATDIEDYTSYANTLRSNAANQVNKAVYDALREKATIEDKRADFY